MRNLIMGGLLLITPAFADDEDGYEDRSVVVQSVPTAYGIVQIRELTPIPSDIAEKVLEGACFEDLVAKDTRLKPLREGAFAYSSLRVVYPDIRNPYGNTGYGQDVGYRETSGFLARIGPRRYGPARDPVLPVNIVGGKCTDPVHVTRFFFFKRMPDGMVPARVLQTVYAVDGNDVLRAARLVRDINSDWRFFRDSRMHVRIGQVECAVDYRPGVPLNATKITYTTFEYNGERWHYAVREESGVWKSGDAFPDQSKFPAAQP